MPPFLSKDSKIRLKIFAWYQIVGGVAGLLLTIWLIAHLEQINGLILLIILFATGLYAFSIYCGRLLLTPKYPRGLRLSYINQVIQIPQFAMLGYAFWYVSGLMLTLGVIVGDGFNFTFNFSLTSTYQISIATGETAFKLAINIAAIFALYFIDKLKTTIKGEEEAYEMERLEALKPVMPNEESINLPE